MGVGPGLQDGAAALLDRLGAGSEAGDQPTALELLALPPPPALPPAAPREAAVAHLQRVLAGRYRR